MGSKDSAMLTLGPERLGAGRASEFCTDLDQSESRQ